MLVQSACDHAINCLSVPDEFPVTFSTLLNDLWVARRDSCIDCGIDADCVLIEHLHQPKDADSISILPPRRRAKVWIKRPANVGWSEGVRRWIDFVVFQTDHDPNCHAATTWPLEWRTIHDRRR